MTIGVLGGGQLGRMLALAGYPLGLDFLFLDKEAGTPAQQVSPQLNGSFTDANLLTELAGRCEDLLNEGKALIGAISDTRLALEISAIHRLAATLTAGLKVRDPLSEKVHFSKAGFAVTALASAAGTLLGRLFRSAKAGTIWGEAR